MKISAIRQQQKAKDRYSVYVDDKYSFSLSESALISSGVSSGIEITAEQLEAYKRLSTEDKLWGRALRYVAARLHSSHEVREYLRRKEAAPELIDQYITRLTDIGLLDDHRYAEAFVENRRLLKPSSTRKLQLELRAKRIPDAIVREVLAEDEGDDKSALRDLVVKKRRQTKYQDDMKLKQYLARQGFGFDDINQALKRDED
jgi:regulatory protein